jgi:hypothetical protein
MRNFLILVFVFITSLGMAQGSFQIINLGNAYRLKAVTIPSSAGIPVGVTSKQLRVSVTCMQTGQTEVTHMPTNAYVDYQLNGNNLIAMSTIFYNGTTQVGKKSMQPKCIFGLNAVQQCFKKL